MIEFHKIQPSDIRWARPLLHTSGAQSCEYSFVNMYMWADVYEAEIAEVAGCVVLRCKAETACKKMYLFPLGTEQNSVAALHEIFDTARRQEHCISLYGMSVQEKLLLEKHFPGRFEITLNRDNSDYVYRSADLAELPGKAYQKKRNHVSRFEKENPGYSFEVITRENLPEVRQFNSEWMQQYDNAQNAQLIAEHAAIEKVFDHYEELGLVGGLIRTGGRVVAYTYASEINANMLDCHVEKALYDLNGAYAVINRDFARQFGLKYQYIDREDDVGDEGLRKAKLSYHPVILADKYLAYSEG